MYRTGNLGVWAPSMDLKFLGRADHQVKVRGYRVELDEIEHLIKKADPTITNAAAIVIQGTIYAFTTPSTIKEETIRESLRQKLPAYAVPQRIFPLEAPPTTPNQKLDRKALVVIATAAHLNARGGPSQARRSLFSERGGKYWSRG